uniref:Uncharacterized protein n=1 Tax=Desertifilum tharense IPPAS B-1220 TaxID=1781255 RepID=A0ACD5GR77_9CYAN
MWAIAFSGTRALAIVTLFFMVPAMGLLLLFSVQGLGWLIFSPNSPGLFPSPSEVQNLPLGNLAIGQNPSLSPSTEFTVARSALLL